MYPLLVFKLNKYNSDCIEKQPTNNIILSNSINIPLFTLGFHYYFHRTKSAMNITSNLETKNEFYNIINPFELIISNYEDSLDKLTKQYFNISDESMEIKSHEFYILWEILLLFNLCDMKELLYANINENTGGFIQAIINYRQKINIGLDKDKIYSANIQNNKNNFELSKEFIGKYNKIYPKLLNIQKNNNNSRQRKYYNAVGGKNINIISNESIKSMHKTISSSNLYANFITANGNLNLSISDNLEEQKSYQLILGEIITAIKIQDYKGNFVLKVFESFTLPTIKLIYILNTFYDDIYIYKPYFSRIYNSDKYIICKSFKYNQVKDRILLDSKIKSLEKCLSSMDSTKFVYDIYPNLILPTEYLDKIKFINIKLANLQQIMINEIIKYIKENNYFGDKYHEHRDKQIEATKWWVNTFYPPSNNLYVKNKEDLDKMINIIINKHDIEFNKFSIQLTK